MNVEVKIVGLHDPEQVKGILDEAARIVFELELDGDLKRAAFEQACELLGKRYVFPLVPQQVPVPLMSIPGNGRR